MSSRCSSAIPDNLLPAPTEMKVVQLSGHTPCARSAKGGLDGAFQWKDYETTIRNYFAARRHLCLGRYDGLQGNLPLPPSSFSEEKISRSPRTTTSQVLQIFRWLIATINNARLCAARPSSHRRQRVRRQPVRCTTPWVRWERGGLQRHSRGAAAMVLVRVGVEWRQVTPLR
jgi:hypothetical protein